MKVLLVGLVCVIAALTVIPNIKINSNQQRVKGEGSVVTRTIEVGDFSEIKLGGNIEISKALLNTANRSADFNYELSEGAPSLQITVDENILPLLDISVDGNTLTVNSKDRKVKLLPSQFVINATSRDLTKVSISGCMNFNAEKPLQLKKLSTSVSGVGDIKMNDLSCEDLSCHVSGVGNIKLAGKADKGDFGVSGVGHIYCYDCVVKDLSCDVSGVGGAQVNASDKLKARVSGVGSIKYKGAASVDSKKSGVGSIECVN